MYAEACDNIAGYHMYRGTSQRSRRRRRRGGRTRLRGGRRKRWWRAQRSVEKETIDFAFGNTNL